MLSNKQYNFLFIQFANFHFETCTTLHKFKFKFQLYHIESNYMIYIQYKKDNKQQQKVCKYAQFLIDLTMDIKFAMKCDT